MTSASPNYRVESAPQSANHGLGAGPQSTNAASGSGARSPNYLRAAISNQYNLILLAGSASFSAALASWAPLVSGLVGEAVWLVAGPRLRSFQRHTEAEIDREIEQRISQGLAPEYVAALAALRAALGRVTATLGARADVSSDQKFEIERRLRPLVRAYAAACENHQRLRRALTEAQPVVLVSEVGRLQHALSGEADLGVRASLRRALSVAERRIRHLETHESACGALQAGLRNFEQSVAALELHARNTSSGNLLSEIDAAQGLVARLAAMEVDREVERLGERTSALPPALN